MYLKKFLLLAVFILALCAVDASFGIASAQSFSEQSDALHESADRLETDRVYRGLKSVFGTILSDDGQETVLNVLFMRFTMMVLIIAAFWTLYLAVTMLVNGARDGSFFGERASGFYAPVRVLFGLVGMYPAFNGFPLLAGIVLLCAKVGIIGANLLNNWAIDFQTKHLTPLSAPITTANTAFVQNLFNMELCKDTINAYVAEQHKVRNIDPQDPKYAIEYIRPVVFRPGGAGSLTWTYRFEGGPAYGRNNNNRVGALCGQINMDLKSFYDEDIENGPGGSLEKALNNPAVWGDLADLHFKQLVYSNAADGDADGLTVGLMRQRVQAVTALIAKEAVRNMDVNFSGNEAVSRDESVIGWLSEIIPDSDSRHDSVTATVAIRRDSALAKSGVTPAHVIALVKQAEAYDHVAGTAAITALSKIDGAANTGGNALRQMFYDEAKAAGWSALGRYWLTITRINSRTLNMASYRPTFTPMDQASIYEVSRSGLERPLRNAFIMAEQFWRFHYDGGAEKISEYYDISREYTGEAAEGSFFSKAILKWLAKNGPGGGAAHTYEEIDDDDYTAGLGNGEIDPISRLTEFGHLLILAVETLVVGGAALGAVSTVIKLASPASKIMAIVGGAAEGGFTFATLVLSLVGLVVLLAGAWFAYIMPYMVFIHYLLAVIGWILLVFEAVCAAPLFALIHMHFDGNDFVSHRMKPGWLIHLAIIVKPMLIVIGFYVSMAMFYIANSLVTADFYPWMMGVVGEHFAGPVTIAVMLGLMWSTYMMTSKMTFRFMTGISDNIIAKWLQGPSTAQGEEQDAHAATAALGHGSNVMGGVFNAVAGPGMAGAAKGAGSAIGRRLAPTELADGNAAPKAPVRRGRETAIEPDSMG